MRDAIMLRQSDRLKQLGTPPRRRLGEISIDDGEQPQDVPARSAALSETGAHVSRHADLDQAFVFIQQKVDHEAYLLFPAGFFESQSVPIEVMTSRTFLGRPVGISRQSPRPQRATMWR
jgi:hypothetical protein